MKPSDVLRLRCRLGFPEVGMCARRARRTAALRARPAVEGLVVARALHSALAGVEVRTQVAASVHVTTASPWERFGGVGGEGVVPHRHARLSQLRRCDGLRARDGRYLAAVDGETRAGLCYNLHGGGSVRLTQNTSTR